MYKIINDQIIQKGNTFFPRSELNSDYQQFVTDVVGIGTTCVEGETVGVTTDYAEARAAEAIGGGIAVVKINPEP